MKIFVGAVLAAACAQRAATAGLEEETAMPNIPVLLHRPTMEKVMRDPRKLRWTELPASDPHVS